MDPNVALLEAVNGIAEEAGRAARSTGGVLPLAARFQDALGAAESKPDLLLRMAVALQAQCQLAAVLHYRHEKQRRRGERLQVLGDGPGWRPEALLRLAELCERVCERGVAEARSTADGLPFPCVAAPMILRGHGGEALVAVPGPATVLPNERLAELLQLATSQLAVWAAQEIATRAEQETRTAAALAELVTTAASASDLLEAGRALTNQLQSFLGGHRVALGLVRGRSRHCQLLALSGLTRFDQHADVSAAMESAMDEALLLDEIIQWPASGKVNQPPHRAHEHLAALLGADALISVPLSDADGGQPVGTLQLVNLPREAGAGGTLAFLATVRQQLGPALRTLQRSQGGLWSRCRRKLAARLPRHRRWVVPAVTLALAALLAWPRPQKIRCDCQLQPVERRFVAAPFDGTLLETKVKPGDVVASDEVLAVMDGREIRLELSALTAEHGRMRKEWEVALAADDIHEAQKAKFEMTRLELKMQLLEERQRNLQVKSPLRGIVVSGDLENSEGAPLKVGQTLFEIAPLERMKVEVIIPEDEIAYVRTGLEARIRLDAHPRRQFTARILQVVPRAEVRDERYVFVAEAELNNPRDLLRPGMNGRLALIGDRAPLAWLLFHKPCESLLMLLGW